MLGIILSSSSITGRKKKFSILVVLVLVLQRVVPAVPANQNTINKKDEFERSNGLIEGDLYIGALFSIHDQPSGEAGLDGGNVRCGSIREQYGIQRAEVALHTIDEINSNINILPSIRLGISIRDSCWYAPVALKQSLKFIPGLDPSSTRTTIGVIGPGSSAVTIQVQNLLQLFNLPQIGYSATSKDLSDKSRFSYFFRVVPSDYYQAKVLVDLILGNRWNYVSVVNTEGNYGQSGMKAFQTLAQTNNICLAEEVVVPQHVNINTDPVFNETISLLYANKNARVIVCFCEGRTVRGLLAAIKVKGFEGFFHIIGSDGWADRPDVIQGLEDAAVGGMSIKIHTSKVNTFDGKYFSLKPQNSVRNPWLQEFWQWRFNCSLNNEEHYGYNTNCTGTEDLRSNYKQDTKLGFVVKAIYTLAHGLHRMQQDLCGNVSSGYCHKMRPFDGKVYKEYLKEVSFAYEKQTVQFDANGDPPGFYDIMNFQRNGNKTDYVTVGTWNNGTLELNKSRPIQFHPKTDHYDVFNSVCSKPCQLGEYKHFQQGKICCWTCVACREEEFLYNETSCKSCHRGSWPNINKTGCDDIPIETLRWDMPECILVMVISTIGLIITFATSGVFIKYNNTPVVKSSSRELSYTILTGIALCFLTTFPLIQEPSHLSCTLSRILPGTAIALIFAALATKTNRIARILLGNKKKLSTRRPRFMTSTAQIIIVGSLIVTETLAVAISIVFYAPQPMLHYPVHTRVKLICHTNAMGVMIPFVFDLFLMLVCTVYAVKTRNVPENFNEAKFIGFSCYTTCVIWLSYIPIWFGSDIKVIATCICLSLSAFVTLAFQFFPKLYIIIFKPHRNNRSFFTTSKDVRCHIGKGTMALMSHIAGGNLIKEPLTDSIKQNGSLRQSNSGSVRNVENTQPGSLQDKRTPGSNSTGATDCSRGQSINSSGSSRPGRAKQIQTEEFLAFCENCDLDVKIYPKHAEVSSGNMKRMTSNRLSIMEENSFSGNNDIKNIVISLHSNGVKRG